ncbi:condensin complex protein MksE [Ningiella sp. W23]|uniref:condensin complex protein MksE n=1 Tax=Ningiella sp. W23 TaxID=3023715 RepID=UPI0037584201
MTERYPESSQLSFSNLNQHISARIYQRFTQGKIIPKLGYDKLKSSSFEDKDYTYLFRYVDEFSLLYRLIGKQLEHNPQGEFFYISSASDNDEDEADEHALKTQSILLVLARHFEMSGRSIDNLSVDSLGFNDEDIAELAANDEYSAICKALKIASWPKAIEYLVNRGFAFETSSNHYFLSSAGKAFCESVIEAYDNK